MQPDTTQDQPQVRDAPAPNALREDLRELGDAASRLARDALGQARAGATDGVESISAVARDVLEPAERFVRERPVAALAIAFAAGWLLAPRRR
jgi:ElaB/YqjD/DUF883 family membrane-anchored ribosome-binding protein